MSFTDGIRRISIQTKNEAQKFNDEDEDKEVWKDGNTNENQLDAGGLVQKKFRTS